MAENDLKTDDEIQWEAIVDKAEEADSQQRQEKPPSKRSSEALREVAIIAFKIALVLLTIYALFYALTFNILSDSH